MQKKQAYFTENVILAIMAKKNNASIAST